MAVRCQVTRAQLAAPGNRVVRTEHGRRDREGTVWLDLDDPTLPGLENAAQSVDADRPQ